MTPRPWEQGTHEERWNGYLLEPGSSVLRNKVGATTTAQLHDAENDLLEARLLELRATPEIVARTYDLAHLCGLHQHLFQDIFEWAGQLRTVGLTKGGGEAFMPPFEVARPVHHVAEKIAETGHLKRVNDADLPREVAYLYDYLNFAHPFREGNGRAQREFFEQLLAESHHGLDWQTVDMPELHDACHVARNHDDLSPLQALFARILTDEPAYPSTI